MVCQGNSTYTAPELISGSSGTQDMKEVRPCPNHADEVHYNNVCTHMHTPLYRAYTYTHFLSQAYVYALGMTMFGALQNGTEDHQVSSLRFSRMQRECKEVAPCLY